MLHLVRHALAGNRPAWTGDDFQRPLDSAGQAQARAIGAELSGRPVKRILSSPALRCTDTVAPLAQALGLEIEKANELAEGASTARTLDLLSKLAPSVGDSVLCSHGDVIPGVIWALSRTGLVIPDRHRCKKASIWELAVTSHRSIGSVISGARYRHPRDFGADFA